MAGAARREVAAPATPPAASPTVVRETGIPGQHGVFAAVDLAPGAVVTEPAVLPVLRVPLPSADAPAEELLEQLPAEVVRAACEATADLYAPPHMAAARLAGVCSVNAFLRAGDGPPVMLLYPREISRFNHSCAPNCSFSNAADNDAATVRVVQAAAAGAELTISYLTESERLLPVGMRRARLQDGWLFHCSCPRCQADEATGDAATRVFVCRRPGCAGLVGAASPCPLCGTPPDVDALAAEAALTAQVLAADESLTGHGVAAHTLHAWLCRGAGLLHPFHWLMSYLHQNFALALLPGDGGGDAEREQFVQEALARLGSRGVQELLRLRLHASHRAMQRAECRCPERTYPAAEQAAAEQAAVGIVPECSASLDTAQNTMLLADLICGRLLAVPWWKPTPSACQQALALYARSARLYALLLGPQDAHVHLVEHKSTRLVARAAKNEAAMKTAAAYTTREKTRRKRKRLKVAEREEERQ